MKKNSQIHLFLETELKAQLEKEASEEGISVSELCRKKIKENSQLLRIEIMLESIIKSIPECRGLYKSSSPRCFNKLK